MVAAQRTGQGDRGDQLAGLQRVFDMRGVAGQAVERVDRDGARRTGGVHRLHLCVQHAHRNRHVAGIGRDAGIAAAHHRQLPRIAADRRASRTRPALVAGLVGVVEIGAAGALEQIARSGRLVAQLAARARHDRAGQHGVIAAHAHVGGQRGVRHEGADAQAALRHFLDPVQLQVLHVDQMGRCLDLQLHQVEEVGAACQELGARPLRHCGRRLCGRPGAFIAEGFHAFAPATSAIASAMLE